MLSRRLQIIEAGSSNPFLRQMRTYRQAVLTDRKITRQADKAGSGYAMQQTRKYSYGREASFEDGSKGQVYFQNESAADKLLGAADGDSAAQTLMGSASDTMEELIRRKRGAGANTYTSPLGLIDGQSAAANLLG